MVKAVVSGLGESLNKGFYLQDVQGDGNPQTSDGIFVYLNDKNFASKYPDIKPGAPTLPVITDDTRLFETFGGREGLVKIMDDVMPRWLRPPLPSRWLSGPGSGIQWSRRWRR